MKNSLILLLFLLSFFACKERPADLERLQAINQSLEKVNRESSSLFDLSLRLFTNKVARGGNSSDGLKAVKWAEDLKKQSEHLFQEIELLKEAFKNSSPEIQDKTESLKKSLEKHIDFLYEEYKDLGFSREKNSFPSLLQLEREETSLDLIKRINQVSSTSAIAWLSYLQRRLLSYQEEIFRELGFADFDTWNWDYFGIANVSAINESNTIIQGEEYKADLYLTRPFPPYDLQTFFEGKLIGAGRGFSELKIPTSKPGKYSWEVEMLCRIGKNDSTFYLRGEYEVIENQ